MPPETDQPLGAEHTAGVGVGSTEAVPTRTPEEAIDEVDRLLDAVEEALATLDEGTYGRCTTCGSAIEPARLGADPLVRECGSCASNLTAATDDRSSEFPSPGDPA